MFYKVMKDGKIVDLLNKLVYVKYQKKHDILLICDIEEAQGVLSSNGETAWHIDGLYYFKEDTTVYEIEEISKYEYNKLKREV